MKRCPKCSTEKTEVDFHKDRRRKDGLACWCKECAKANSRRYSKYGPQTPPKRSTTKDGLRRRCFVCHVWKSIEDFTKGTYECKACKRIRSRKQNRNRTPEQRERDRQSHKKHYHEHVDANARREKIKDTPAFKARAALQAAIRYGRIQKPKECSSCGKATEPRRLHAHHDDYEKPLDVEWLCSICHGKRHRVYDDACRSLKHGGGE